MHTVVSRGIYIRRQPTGQVPILFEIPRSGTRYPIEFRSVAPLIHLQKSVSMYVEECFEEVTEAGATWLFATFPNSFIDLNRHEQDIDPGQLADGWDGVLSPSPNAARGSGLIPTLCDRDIPIYAEKVTASEVELRLTDYYRPYHAEVARLLSAFVDDAGVALHMSCHSMFDVVPSGPDAGERRSDIDLGDRNGTTCSPALTDAAAAILRDLGYVVTVNRYFVGAEAVRKHGDPTKGVHSLQIELNRKLYMDEASGERLPNVQELKQNLAQFAAKLSSVGRELAL